MTIFMNLSRLLSILAIASTLLCGYWRLNIIKDWENKGGTVNWNGNVLFMIVIAFFGLLSLYFSFGDRNKLSIYMSIAIITILMLSIVSFR